MTIQEILEAHTVKRPWSEASRMKCKCGQAAIAETEAQLYALHRAHVAEVLEKEMQEREAEVLDGVLAVLNSEAEDAPPANYEEDNYEAGYVAGLVFAEKFTETRANQYKEEA